MIMNDFVYFVISYALIIIMGFFFINFLSNGFFGTFLRVKASRGKKVLVEVHSVTDVYYRAGKFDESILIYKTREGRKKSLSVSQEKVIRKIGVFCIITDEITDNVIDYEFNAHKGGDTVTYDHLLRRVIMAPQIENMREKIMFGLLILLLVVAVFSGFIIFDMANKVTLLSGEVARILETARVI